MALTYNGLDDLITRTEGGVTTRYFYNYAVGLAPVMTERNETATQVVRHYVWSPGGRLLYLIEAATGNAVRHYHFDRVGSTLALTDASGAMTDAYAYTPYGELLGRTGTNPQPFRYVGEFGVRSEPAATLYHMRARFYDPATGRFLSREPIWPKIANPRLLDPYQYALGAPGRFIDPTGLSPTTEDLGNPYLENFATGHPDIRWDPSASKGWAFSLAYILGLLGRDVDDEDDELLNKRYKRSNLGLSRTAIPAPPMAAVDPSANTRANKFVPGQNQTASSGVKSSVEAVPPSLDSAAPRAWSFEGNAYTFSGSDPVANRDPYGL